MKPRRPKTMPTRCWVDGERLTYNNVPAWFERAEGDPLWRFCFCYGCGAIVCEKHDAIPMEYVSGHTKKAHAKFVAAEL